MNITQPEMVTRHYCDNCGKEMKGTRYGYEVDGVDHEIGSCCYHIWDAIVRKDRINAIIKEQPYFGIVA
jgi:hypothetical protein